MSCRTSGWFMESNGTLNGFVRRGENYDYMVGYIYVYY